MAETRSFHLLDSQVQRWIWNQGWASLLEIQENTIPLVLEGKNDIIVSAPTGGGKTEAVFLPIISRMLREPIETGYSVLYISPLKALINDQTRRLTDLCESTGIRVTPWHGDVDGEKKSRSFKEPSGILIITPESLESMMMHRREGLAGTFANLQYIVIDEIHSFVGKERGKQVQSLLGRVEFLAGRIVCRIGMSATLSDYEDIKAFIRPDKSIRCEVPKAGCQVHEIKVLIKEFLAEEEYDCAYQIAEDIYAHLRKSNNLVFTQSRASAEDFTGLLTDISSGEGVPNEFYIHHGSIDKEDRHLLEQRLNEGKLPTTAICTSTLELGIDVGSIKSIAQIGTCPSVSSLRQRLGRSGRRNAPSILRVYSIDWDMPDDPMSNLSLSLIQNIALIELIRENRYEPYNIARFHFSTLIQQTLSVLAQYGSFYAKEGWMLLCRNGAFNNVTPELFLDLLKALGEQGIISQTHTGQIIIGEQGEKIVQNADFYAAFTSPEDIQVIDTKTGRNIGTINCVLEEGVVFALSGRNWLVLERDSGDTRLFVEQVQSPGKFYFSSSLIDTDKIIVNKMREIFVSNDVYSYLDSPAKDRLILARSTFIKLGLDHNNIITFSTEEESFREHSVYFTWAGTRINRTLCLAAQRMGEDRFEETACYISGLTQETVDEIRSNGEFDSIELASLRDRREKELEKYDYLLPDNLLDAEYAKGYLDVEGMISFLKSDN